MLTRGSKKFWGVCDGCQVALVSDDVPEGVADKLAELSVEEPTITYTPPYSVLCDRCSADPAGSRAFGRAARDVARHYGINPLEVEG